MKKMINAEELLKELDGNMDPYEFEYVEFVVKKMQEASDDI